jgi:hypothetical protein
MFVHVSAVEKAGLSTLNDPLISSNSVKVRFQMEKAAWKRLIMLCLRGVRNGERPMEGIARAKADGNSRRQGPPNFDSVSRVREMKAQGLGAYSHREWLRVGRASRYRVLEVD